MSFVIEPAGRLDEAIRRAVHVELTRAVANLTLPPVRLHEGVHEARKSFKRLRALFRLLRAADPAAAAREVARFREVAGSIAEARDAAALVEAFERLEATFPTETRDGSLAPVGEFLRRRRDTAVHADSGIGERVVAAIAACRVAYEAMDVFPLPHRRAAAERLVAEGMAATLKKARRALNTARRDGDPQAFHTLRKRVKDHLYHLGLIRHVWPKAGSARRASFDDLGERLGDLNDCDVLLVTLMREAPTLAESAAGEKALELLVLQAQFLRRHVLVEAERLLATPPSVVRKKVARRLRKARRPRPGPLTGRQSVRTGAQSGLP
jgi:CHAD domain-containing protein